MREATIRSRHPKRAGLYQVQSSGDRVWVNGPDGASVARISKHGGIDVHRPLSEQQEHGECLDCRNDLRGAAAWQHFIASVAEHFGVRIAERHRPTWANDDGNLKHPPAVLDLIDVLSREGFGVATIPARHPPGKGDEPRRCLFCGWTGKRADTIDLGWCPKCRSITEETANG